MSTNLARGGPAFPGDRGIPESRAAGTEPLLLPPELPSLPPHPRVLQLTHGDCVSCGLAEGTGRDYASDQEMRSCLRRASRPVRKRPAWLADLVILVAQDESYAPPVRQLRLLGIPTWLLVPGLSAAAVLRGASCAISSLGASRPFGPS